VSPFIVLAINAISSLLKLRDDGAFGDLKDDINALRAKLDAKLPKKEDGSAWTDADIHDAATSARVGFDNVLARGAGATD